MSPKIREMSLAAETNREVSARESPVFQRQCILALTCSADRQGRLVFGRTLPES